MTKEQIEFMNTLPICDKCKTPIFPPTFCCNGVECGCMGLPVDPPCDCWLQPDHEESEKMNRRYKVTT